MKFQLAIAFIALAAATSNASANGPISPRASDVDKIVQGHGNPGDTANAKSDAVTFEVLGNGLVKRTNTKYGTVSVFDPAEELRKSRTNR
ncbi:hypothetical protein FB009_12029 [Sinorhizobium medicae]|uniref:hypothetical protein n=1 Tax=Rhizobiaceae TaxID=82115 RepID=UPI001199710F|nr:hypothetical protein [Sinorhizobium medicae]MQU73580.1 hypothetical protein [Sinorhizobium medicae]TWA33328.1 hypothetical protein FB009_12029 [Sinorhizobium medicae]